MADITPVTREEFYLAKAGGQDVPVPSAVTREEHYLEKLSNDSVVVPTPVTRREKFLYFACGGEIDLPSEDRMTRLERLIAKAGGMDVSTPTAVTRLEKFWVNVEGGGWKTITGVLPLTFTAKSGIAVDWVIYGNDDNGTENLADVSKSGMVQISAGGDMRYGLSLGKLEVGNYTVVYTSELVMYTTKCLSNNTYASAPAPSGTVITITSNIDELIFRTTSATETTWEAAGVSDIMIVKGSAAPDHYIPYQRGVGERTENLVSPIRTANGWKQGYRQKNNGKYITTHNSGEWLYDVYIPIDSTSFTFWATSVSGQASGTFYFFDSIKNYLTNTAIDFNNYNNTGISDLPANAAYMQFAFRTFCMSEQEVIDNNYQVMLVKGNTAPQTFIPYGYQIPLTASQQGQPDKTYDIYIGDSPLTEGETVSKTSTGVDIELFGGKNTVSTTLYNKPTMEIKYK